MRLQSLILLSTGKINRKWSWRNTRSTKSLSRVLSRKMRHKANSKRLLTWSTQGLTHHCLNQNSTQASMFSPAIVEASSPVARSKGLLSLGPSLGSQAFFFLMKQRVLSMKNLNAWSKRLFTLSWAIAPQSLLPIGWRLLRSATDWLSLTKEWLWKKEPSQTSWAKTAVDSPTWLMVCRKSRRRLKNVHLFAFESYLDKHSNE